MTSVFPPRYRIGAIVLLAIPFVLRLIVAWQDVEALQKRAVMVPDDTFYELGIARHVVQGQGFTFDGVNPTTGFQPLFTFLLVPVEAIASGNTSLPLHLALTLDVLFSVIAAWGLWRVSRRMMSGVGAFVAVFLFAWSGAVFEHATNGLETSLAICAEVWAVEAFFVWRADPSARHRMMLAAAVMIAVLSRIDAAVVGAGIAVAAVLWGDRVRWSGAFTALSGVAAGVAATSAFALIVDGGVLPCSGPAVASLGRAYLVYSFPGQPALLAAARAAGRALLIAQPTTEAGLAIAGNLGHALGGIGIVIAAICLWRARPWHAVLRSYFAIALTAAALLVIFYVVVAPGFWFYPRYFFPIVVFSFPLYGAAFDRVRHHPAIRMIALVAAAAYAVVEVRWSRTMLTGSYVHRTDHDVRNTDISSLAITHAYDAAVWVRANLPDSVRIAAWQGATVGYFSGRCVVNCDGVVNRTAFRMRREHKLGGYLRNMGCSIVIDEPRFVDYLRQSLGDGARLVSLGVAQSDGSGRPPMEVCRIEYE